MRHVEAGSLGWCDVAPVATGQSDRAWDDAGRRSNPGEILAASGIAVLKDDLGGAKRRLASSRVNMA